MKVIVFDTETTGLPQGKPSIYEHEKWPHVLQLSYLVYDTITMTVMEVHDGLIKIDNNVNISKESMAIHGITKKVAQDEGVLISESLALFNTCLQQCDVIIGHNIEFDRKLIQVECLRNNISQCFNKGKKPRLEYCTMKIGTNLCKIIAKRDDGVEYYKWPKLSQLHKHLFNRDPKNLHNSLVDILVCLRCYCMMTKGVDLCIKSRSFRYLVRGVF